MAIVQVVLEDELLRAVDRAAGRRRVNRSALVRDALRLYLRELATRDRERRDRAGYERQPDAEFSDWNRVTAWPENSAG